MPGQQLRASESGAGDFPPETVHVIPHLLFRVFEGVEQCRVQLLDVAAQAFEQPRQVLLALVETFGPAFGEAGGGDLPVQMLFTLPHVRDAEAIFFQQLLGATVHQRKRGAGEDGRHRASELRVDGV